MKIRGKLKLVDNDKEQVCVLCNETFTGWGNNPHPLAEEGVACDSCNFEKVVPSRMKANDSNAGSVIDSDDIQWDDFGLNVTKSQADELARKYNSKVIEYKDHSNGEMKVVFKGPKEMYRKYRREIMKANDSNAGSVIDSWLQDVAQITGEITYSDINNVNQGNIKEIKKLRRVWRELLKEDPEAEDELFDIGKRVKKALVTKATDEDNPYAQTYRMLSRLKQDVLYFLGNGNRAEKYLWALSVEDHIAEMRKLYSLLPEGEKPEWLTEEDINQFEKEMTSKPVRKLRVAKDTNKVEVDEDDIMNLLPEGYDEASAQVRVFDNEFEIIITANPEGLDEYFDINDPDDLNTLNETLSMLLEDWAEYISYDYPELEEWITDELGTDFWGEGITVTKDNKLKGEYKMTIPLEREYFANDNTGNEILKAKDGKQIYTVIYNYFKPNGDQEQKEITRMSLKSLISAMSRHLQNNQLYEIKRVSQNLYDYDFTQHGPEFEEGL